MSQETEIKTRISLLEMEKGFLTTARRNGSAEVGAVASKIEMERESEIQRLRGQLQQLKRAA